VVLFFSSRLGYMLGVGEEVDEQSVF
jgi:hypothetical protein